MCGSRPKQATQAVLARGIGEPNGINAPHRPGRDWFADNGNVMAMHVGVARVALQLAENNSLKGKRTVVKSVVQRVRNRFNVAIAEVDTQDTWETVTLGIVCVSDDPRHANEMLSKVIDFIESERLDAEVGAVEFELIPV
jgi:uncharacterized protein YlxP (DUF503 family)